MKDVRNFECRKGGCLFTLVKLALLAAVVALVAAYFCLGYIGDYAIKTATSGTSVTGGVGNIKINISQESVEITDFVLKNPAKKYRKENALSFKRAFVDLDVSPSDLIFKKLVVVDELTVEDLALDLEKASDGTISGTNITEISDALKAKYGLDKRPSQPAQSDAASPAENKRPLKFIIKKMTFKNGSASSSILGSYIETPIPDFALENIGLESGGKTVGEIIAEILPQIAAQATNNIIKNGWNGSVKIEKDASKSIKEAINTLFK